MLLGLIPFYYPLKLAFLIWLAHPSTQGARVIYGSFVLPFWRDHQDRIEEVSRGIETKLKAAGLSK